MVKPSTTAWHAIVSACAHYNSEESLLLHYYQHMLSYGIKPLDSTILVVLRACGNMRALSLGRVVHDDLIRHGIESDIISGSLVSMYSRCGTLIEARFQFDRMTSKTVVTWNLMISGYAQFGQAINALDIFERMHHSDIIPNQITFSSILKACSLLGARIQGLKIHHYLIECGVDLSSHISCSLIDMYTKNGTLDDALNTFRKLTKRSIVAWNAMISGFVHQGHAQSAIQTFIQMLKEEMCPDNSTLSNILKACAVLKSRQIGSLTHGLIVESGHVMDIVTVGAMVDMYVKIGHLGDARRVFQTATSKSKATWGALITGYAERDQGILALKLFSEMLRKGISVDEGIYASVFKACTSIGSIQEGRLLHNYTIRQGIDSNRIIGNSMVDMYNRCGMLDDGYKVFHGLPKDLTCWSTMIAGYVQHHSYDSALRLFIEMLKQKSPDKFTFSNVLKLFGSLKAKEQGKCIHDWIFQAGLEVDDFLGINLIDMYSNCGDLEEASHMFDNLKEKPIAAWTSIIAGYAQHGNITSAFKYLDGMIKESIKPDEVLLMCLLKASNSLGSTKKIHEKIRQIGFEDHVELMNTIIDMYVKTGCLDDARSVFNGLSQKDIVSWNSMLAGYTEHLMNIQAFEIYCKMQHEGLFPDSFTFSCISKACVQCRGFDKLNLIYEHVIRTGFESNLVIAKTLIKSYGQCGSAEDAHKVFNNMPNKDASSWSLMVSLYAQQHNFDMSNKLLAKMQALGLKVHANVQTDILAAYTRAGEMHCGQGYFDSVMKEKGGEFSKEHFNCAVDLLGRMGLLQEANELLHTMPNPPDMIGQTSLLSARRQHCNL